MQSMGVALVFIVVLLRAPIVLSIVALLLAVGIAAASRPSRIAALGLLVATILKCFLHDLARLGGLYRVMSFVGLAICLALVAVALQRFVLSVRKELE